MKTWRDSIIEQFIPKISKLSLVSDPDNLLTEEKMSTILRHRGFDILEFNDAIEFRYAYESQYRIIWDKGLQTELVVIIHTRETDLYFLPYDLLEKGKRFHFSIAEIFPVFSPSVLNLLDKTYLDILYSSMSNYPKDRISDYSTIDYLLRYVYRIDINVINNEIDLIKALLHIHYNDFDIPLLYLQRLEYLIADKKIFDMLPIKELLNNKDFFIEYLAEKHREVISNSPEVHFFNSLENDIKKIDTLLQYLENMEITEQAYHAEWINIAWKHAYLASIIYRNSNSNYYNRLESVYTKINEQYEKWLVIYYSSLRTIPPVSPAMVHHIPHFLAYNFSLKKLPIALIVIDGLALNQWITLRDSMLLTNIQLTEKALYAWIPTLTSISRQSIFSGKTPYEYEDSIHTTDREQNFWSLFWENNGLIKQNIIFLKGVDTEPELIDLKDQIIPNKTMIAGLVINKIDNIMHGAELGMEGFHKDIVLYGKNGHLNNLIEKLLENNFEIWITSDHGNTACIGRGKPNEASIAQSRGERVRIYKSMDLLETVKNKFSWSDYWKPVGLPRDYLPLIAKENNAFLPNNKQAISHGGISMQETIVPFIKIARKQDDF